MRLQELLQDVKYHTLIKRPHHPTSITVFSNYFYLSYLEKDEPGYVPYIITVKDLEADD